MELETKDDRSDSAEVSEPQSAPILIIDDDSDFRRALGLFLTKLGFRALEANDAMEGLALVRESEPGAILLDLCLGKNPEDTASSEFVLKILKSSATARAVPVIAISGIHRDVATEARFKRFGAESFFTKGELFDAGPFIRNLRACLLKGESSSPSGSEAASLNDVAEAETIAVSGGLPIDSTVIVIDDESDTFELLKVLFKGQPYKIHWADNGVKGLSLAKTELPDLAILDLHMSGLDGKEVCRRLRVGCDGLYLPILMLTGDARVRQEIQCLDIGADDYLMKSSPITRLAARIRGLIRRRRYGMDSRGLIRIGGASLDCRNHRIVIARRRAVVPLTKTEAGILMLLMSAAGRLVDSAALHKKVCRVWPRHDSTAIKTHVSHIRHKFGDLGGLIESVNGEDGYRFNVEFAKTLI